MRPSTGIKHEHVTHSSRDSSISIVTGYGLSDRDSIPGRGRNIHLRHSAQTGSEAHPASHPMGTGSSFPRIKRQVCVCVCVCEADHSPPSSAEVKNAWSYTSVPRIFIHVKVLC
jgi:hypothetical protein